ncbi:MAG: NUDIX hydrolase [Actinomycetota bacterium]|nr:NUDIX hydrolase [Actinomycetota bacterium]
MRWTVHGERNVYDSEWVSLAVVDVEVPGSHRFDHHVVRMPGPAVGVVVYDDDLRVLLLWRHRFITDSWGWEIPAGRVDAGEELEAAAAREVLEETGWAVGPLRPMVAYHPTNGLSDQLFNVFIAQGADFRADPTDTSEAERIEWIPLREVRGLVNGGAVRDGLSLTALAYALAFGAFR